MNTRLALLLSAVLNLVWACGDSEETDPARELITFSAGDSDPLGCTYMIPEPWVSEEVHRESCSEGCVPLRVEDLFAACIAIPGYPPDIALFEENCLTHPVTREELTFPDSGGSAVAAICWGWCENREPCEKCLNIPDECFEEVAP